MIRTFMQAVKFLEGYIPTPDKKHPGELGVIRMKYLMDMLGNPQLKYPTIHVGGTSGKGSTATIIASILATKYKVGLHTSPHLIKINERIEIFSRGPLAISARGPLIKRDLIADDEFIKLMNKIIPSIKELEKSEYGRPSYFEIVTAMAFLYFHMQKVDFAVIEVGMGGRFDATNVIRPEVAVLTNVGLDHTEILGDTVEKIAEDKAGIIKSNMIVVSGVRQPSVINILNEKCRRKNAKLSLLVPPPGRSPFGHLPGVFTAFSYHVRRLDSEGSEFDYKGIKSLKDLRIGLIGEHQVENAVLAIRAIEISRGPLAEIARGPLIKEKDIRLGLKSVFIPGRLEIVQRKPLVILDGAHNPDKVRALVTAIKQIFPKKKITAVIAIKNDKNAKEMLTQLLKISEKVVFTKFQLTADIGIINSYDPNKLLGIGRTIDKDKSMLIIHEVKKAVEEAIKSAGPDDLILVTGSLYLVGEIKSALSVKGKAESERK